MTEEVVFLDTYALFELLWGNSKYEEYSGVTGITTLFNLAELNYGLKKDFSIAIADEFTSRFERLLVPLSVDDIKSAMSLRIKNKNLSIPDAVGYSVAQRLGIKFLTGDDDFKEFSEVILVKK